MTQVVAGRAEPVGLRLGSGRKGILAREDWALLVIAASDGLLPIQLQKSLFLLGQRFPELGGAGFYEFRPVGRGDFSEQIYLDANAFSKKGLVSIRFSDADGNRLYRLTPSGAERAKRLEKQMPPERARSLRKLVSWVTTRSVEQLLRGSAETSSWIKPDSGSH